MRETTLSVDHLILPLFIFDGEGRQPIASMPGQARLGRAALLEEVGAAKQDGVGAIVLFPAEKETLKTPDGAEAYNPNGLVPESIRAIKAVYPDMIIVTDVALDPYSSDGHDGLVNDRGEIMNDETVDILVRQALVQAEAGADIIAPSDMMDGRIGAIRDALDASGHTQVSIMSYTAKYASAFYGPFRDALDSAPKFGDKKTYQMDPANVRRRSAKLRLMNVKAQTSSWLNLLDHFLMSSGRFGSRLTYRSRLIR